MTIIGAIDRVDSLMHNTYSQTDKVLWLSNLDWKVKRQIIDTHEGGEAVSFAGYGADVDLQTELLARAPFDEMYLRWLEAQICYHNGEYEMYNAAITMFNTAYEAYRNDYNRTHMPKGVKFRYF